MRKISIFTVLILFLFISCSDSSSLKNSNLTAPETESAGSNFAPTDNNALFYVDAIPDFDYSDTMYGKDYRVEAFPDPLVLGYTYFTSLIYPAGQPDTARYMIPHSCGDYVFIHEDGTAARFRSRAACE